MEQVKQMELLFSQEDKEILELCKKYKLSVSGVKYSRGHDGDCMECNLKVGTKIKGWVWDDSWGGEYQYQGDNVQEALNVMDTIVNEGPKFNFNGKESGNYDYDIIVSLLTKDFESRKNVKKKTFVIGVKEKPTKDNFEYMYKQQFTYNCEYGTHGVNEESIINDFTKDGFYAIQIVNKMYM